MRKRIFLTLCLGAVPLAAGQQPAPLVTQAPAGKWAIVLHGGAGVIERSSMTPERDAAYRAGLDRAIHAAAKVLGANGSAVDAVEAGLRVLEDDPLFNAGKGAVFTAEGKNELDAAIMDGKTLDAGAVAGVTRTKNPISLAKAVMEKSPHVMLIGAGADQFAASVGLEQVNPSYFFTEARWESLVRQLKKEGRPIPPRPVGVPPAPGKPIAQLETPDAHKWARRVLWCATVREISQRARRQEGRRPSGLGELGIHRSSGREPMRRTSRVECRRRGRANTSFG